MLVHLRPQQWTWWWGTETLYSPVLFGCKLYRAGGKRLCRRRDCDRFAIRLDRRAARSKEANMRWVSAVFASLRVFALAAFAGSFAQAQQSADPDDRAWESTQQLGTAEAFQRYLEQFPVGRHVEEAFRGLVEQQVESELGQSHGTSLGVDMY